ncbi:hypothetical protein PTW35_22555 (plasmid) [Photobacterium sp. DA100]|uniref:hypothetical protein n=1 Tax=Photobacterium sp. DA100 TaxID=3027472 RepID=UPI002478F466|nr:hypothetical protein [Photobacterium sp. DA100]WEM45854.1 hypothetical protein PTW35_22555 [Photobacterium sp. DA100]
MDIIECWLTKVKNADIGNDWQEPSLSQMLNDAPPELFGLIVSPYQYEAIAYWLTLCQRLSQIYQDTGRYDLTFHYMQFSYSKIQAITTAPQQDEAIRRWGVKKLELMVIGMVEFCRQQALPIWLCESQQLVELHVHFMKQLHHQNLSLGPVIRTSQGNDYGRD